MAGAIVKPFKITSSVDYDLRSLTAPERLVLWRYRQRATNGRLFGRSGSSMSQNEAAAALNIPPKVYGRLEQGLATALTANDITAMLAALGPLDPMMGELCFIARRRSGLTLPLLAEQLSISRPWVLSLEREADDRIIKYWEGAGYVFP